MTRRDEADRGRARSADARVGGGDQATAAESGESGESDGPPAGPLSGARTARDSLASAGRPGAIVWFTGLPASGKTTLARRVQAQLAAGRRAAVVLDSDELRDVLGSHGYAPADRARFYGALCRLAVLLARQRVVVLVAATAPRREDREPARVAMGAGSARGAFIEVWVATPLEACEARDPKGLYAAARRGEASQLPGVGVAYEAPEAPDVTAGGGQDDAAVAAILGRLALSGV